jgi:hypothetical protein
VLLILDSVNRVKPTDQAWLEEIVGNAVCVLATRDKDEKNLKPLLARFELVEVPPLSRREAQAHGKETLPSPLPEYSAAIPYTGTLFIGGERVDEGLQIPRWAFGVLPSLWRKVRMGGTAPVLLAVPSPCPSPTRGEGTQYSKDWIKAGSRGWWVPTPYFTLPRPGSSARGKSLG